MGKQKEKVSAGHLRGAALWQSLIRNRRGEEFVEAAMVLPILILTILSMILLILYFYLCLNTQVEVHGRLLWETAQSDALFRVLEEKDAASGQIGGLLNMVMEKKIEGRMYALDHAAILRAGEFIGLD